jgi:hypothetical protein
MYISFFLEGSPGGTGGDVAVPEYLARTSSQYEDDANPPANPSEGGVAVPWGLSIFVAFWARDC